MTELHLQMGEEEILQEYKYATKKFDQVRILAELNCVSKKEMATWLKEHGCEVDGRYFREPPQHKTKAEEPAPVTPPAPWFKWAGQATVISKEVERAREAGQMAIDALKSNDIIACGDCKYYIPHDKRCGYWNHGVQPLMWCSQAERRWRDDER